MILEVLRLHFVTTPASNSGKGANKNSKIVENFTDTGCFVTLVLKNSKNCSISRPILGHFRGRQEILNVTIRKSNSRATKWSTYHKNWPHGSRDTGCFVTRVLRNSKNCSILRLILGHFRGRQEILKVAIRKSNSRATKWSTYNKNWPNSFRDTECFVTRVLKNSKNCSTLRLILGRFGGRQEILNIAIRESNFLATKWCTYHKNWQHSIRDTGYFETRVLKNSKYSFTSRLILGHFRGRQEIRNIAIRKISFLATKWCIIAKVK